MVALVVTIIVLLILAGVSILVGENGILNQATKAKESLKEATIIEQIELEEMNTLSNSNKILWASPFNYQLIKSVEQEKIEKKLGRKLEASDLFYEVDMTKTNYPEEKGAYIIRKKRFWYKLIKVN